MLNKLKLSFSFSWSAAMQISWNIRNFGEILHTRKEFYPHRSPQDPFCTPIWPPWREIDLYTPNSNCIIKKPVTCLETIKQCLIKHTEN